MKTQLFGFIVHLGLHHVLRLAKRGNITVLSLHRITDESEPFFEPIRPAMFHRLLEYVSRHYTVTTFNEAANAKSSKPLLVLSFDDGYHDFIEYAMPILEKFRMRANHNLVNACLHGNFLIWTFRLNHIIWGLKTRKINHEQCIQDTLGIRLENDEWNNYYLKIFRALLDRSFAEKTQLLDSLEQRHGIQPQARMISWAEAASLPKEQVEIGCHTYHHDSLNQDLDLNTLRTEIADSKLELSSRLNRDVNVIAFPNGQTSPAAIEFCQEQNFRFLLLVNDKVSPKASFASLSNGLKVSRIGLNDESYAEMILRSEQFHANLRGIIKKIRK